jgi:hypothetical protein
MQDKQNRILQLAEAVAASFESAGYTPGDLLQGPVKITDLPWQAPPLRAVESLRGVPIHEYLDYPLGFRPEEAYFAYNSTLDSLVHDPGLTANRDGYLWVRRALPGASPGERKLTFPLPDGWPGHDHTAQGVFAMEMVRAFLLYADRCSGFFQDDDNYRIMTEWGPIGIEGGAVIGSPDAQVDAFKGYVSGMLEAPRGQVTSLCHYDLLARLRSTLHEEPDRFVEWQGTDTALQALRLLCEGKPLTALLKAVSDMSVEAARRRLRVTAFKEAVGIMESWNYTDRTKISMLQELLVPSFMSLNDFAKKIMDPYKILPAVLPRKTESRILSYLRYVLKKADDNVKTYQPQRPPGD